jgi:hypothetical protein
MNWIAHAVEIAFQQLFAALAELFKLVRRRAENYHSLN